MLISNGSSHCREWRAGSLRRWPTVHFAGPAAGRSGRSGGKIASSIHGITLVSIRVDRTCTPAAALHSLAALNSRADISDRGTCFLLPSTLLLLHCLPASRKGPRGNRPFARSFRRREVSLCWCLISRGVLPLLPLGRRCISLSNGIFSTIRCYS